VIEDNIRESAFFLPVISQSLDPVSWGDRRERFLLLEWQLAVRSNSMRPPEDNFLCPGVPVFGSDGKELLTLSGPTWIAMDTVQVWDISLKFRKMPKSVFKANNEPAPEWLADLARAVSGIPPSSLDEDDSSLTLSTVRKSAKKENVRAPYTEVWQHFFDSSAFSVEN